MKPSRKDIKDLFILISYIRNPNRKSGNNDNRDKSGSKLKAVLSNLCNQFKLKAVLSNLCNQFKRIKFYCKNFPNYFYSGILFIGLFFIFTISIICYKKSLIFSAVLAIATLIAAIFFIHYTPGLITQNYIKGIADETDNSHINKDTVKEDAKTIAIISEILSIPVDDIENIYFGGTIFASLREHSYNIFKFILNNILTILPSVYLGKYVIPNDILKGLFEKNSLSLWVEGIIYFTIITLFVYFAFLILLYMLEALLRSKIDNRIYYAIRRFNLNKDKFSFENIKNDYQKFKDDIKKELPNEKKEGQGKEDNKDEKPPVKEENHNVAQRSSSNKTNIVDTKTNPTTDSDTPPQTDNK